MCYIEIGLANKTIDSIGQLFHEEHADLCMHHDSKIICGGTLEQVIQREDCRIYRYFVKIQSLYSSTKFMKGKPEEAQIKTLFRIEELYKLNGFRTVQEIYVPKQYKQAVLSLPEKNKFLK